MREVLFYIETKSFYIVTKSLYIGINQRQPTRQICLYPVIFARFNDCWMRKKRSFVSRCVSSVPKSKKYKAHILKYVPYILKYMACIFHYMPYVFFGHRKTPFFASFSVQSSWASESPSAMLR